MDKKIFVTSDSTCSLPRDKAKEIGLNILPLNVIVNGEEYHDGIDIDIDKLSKMMRDKADIKTSTPTPYEIEEFFDSVFAQGADHIIHFTISHKLSSMFDLFTNLCKEKYGDKVTVINSLSVCQYQLNHGLTAMNMVKRGCTVEEIVKTIEERKGSEDLVFIPESLTFLRRGGRVSPAIALIGNMIGMTPILRFKDGGLEKEGTTRNIKKTIKEVFTTFASKNYDPKVYEIGMVVADTNENIINYAVSCAKELMPEFKCKVDLLSINVCAHAGPGTIGMCV